MNLTGAATPAERVRVLVARALPALPFVRPGRLLDLGSGNGSPGLVLALLRPDVQATLLEPRLRRWAFLREAARACEARNVEVVRARHDSYAGDPALTLTLRALVVPLAELAPLVVCGGRLIVLGRAAEIAAPFIAEGRDAGDEARAPAGAPDDEALVHVYRRDGRDVSRET